MSQKGNGRVACSRLHVHARGSRNCLPKNLHSSALHLLALLRVHTPKQKSRRENAALKRTQRQRRSLLILIHWGLPLSHSEPESPGGGASSLHLLYLLSTTLSATPPCLCSSALGLWRGKRNICSVAAAGQTQRPLLQITPGV